MWQGCNQGDFTMDLAGRDRLNVGIYNYLVLIMYIDTRIRRYSACYFPQIKGIGDT